MDEEKIKQITVSRAKKIPLSRQLFGQISRLILNGTMRAGERIPSSRALADMLLLSRNVVTEAMEQLAAEGFLESRKGSGTYVAEGIRVQKVREPEKIEFEKVGFEDVRTDITDFRSGLPDMRHFPRHIWLQITKEVYSSSLFDPLSYHQPEGSKILRDEIASYISSRRGGDCSPEQIVITSGTTQAISLVSRLLINKKKHVVFIEDPITMDIQEIIRNNNGTVKGVQVENDGIAVPPQVNNGAFIYTTPSHQFPLGITMTVQKRTALLEYVRKTGIYLVEDDYDSEFRFDGPPVSCIQGLDPEKVIYIGTFSKTLCPAFRIGYLVLPYKLVNRGRQLKWFTDLHSPIPNQLVLAEFIRRGHYTRHITKMRKIYKERRLFFEKELKNLFNEQIEILGSSTGIHLCVKFHGVKFDQLLLAEIEKAGAKVYPVEIHTLKKGKYSDTVILGYGCLEKEQIKKGIKVLFHILKELGTESIQ